MLRAALPATARSGSAFTHLLHSRPTAHILGGIVLNLGSTRESLGGAQKAVMPGP